MSGEIVPRKQPTEIERQATWEQHANALAARYAGFVSVEDLSPEEKVISLVSLVPMAMDVVDEARDTIERLNEELAEEERLRGLLVEALARLEALDVLPGDFGGPFHVRDVADLETAMRWIQCVRTDPPSWDDDEHDPLEQWREAGGDQLDTEISDRAWLYVRRLHEQLVAYHDRRKAADPTHQWGPWWRTR